MERNQEALPIKEKDLRAHNDKANALLKKVSYAPKVVTEPVKKSVPGEMTWTKRTELKPEPKEVSILASAHTLNPDSDVLLPNKINATVNTVLNGLRIGIYLGKLYEKTSNLETLTEQNRLGLLESSSQKVEFREKHNTLAAITVYSAAYYISYELSRMEGVESKVEIGGVPEVNLQSWIDGINCMLYHYGAYLARPDTVATADDFVRVTLLYFKAMTSEIKSREGSLKYTEPFTSRVYKLDGSEFSVNGFNVNLNGVNVTVEFNRVEIGEIVGNRIAKRQAKLLAQRLMCYDFQSKSNPMMKLGGLPKLRMGDGPPGTGKSMLIAAIATLLSDYCKALKYQFAFRPLPDNIVSTFQGGTAEKAVEWFMGFQDPTKIIYGPIDDGEVVLEDRTRHNVSAGVREFIGVFLRRTEGAYAINHGNFTIDIFTNLPDQIDKAVLSRIVSRFLIAGAESTEDFVDQDYIWWRKYQKAAPDFVDLHEYGYKYMSLQTMLGSVAEAMDKYDEPKDERLCSIFKKVCKQHELNSSAFFGALYKAVREDFPFFTSRDVRNIQTAVDGRILDFELPDEWLDHPDKFYYKSYDDKHQILVDMMKNNLKGLSFAQVKLQETVFYLDQMVRIAEVTRERRIDEGVQNVLMSREIDARLNTLREQGKLAHLGLTPQGVV